MGFVRRVCGGHTSRRVGLVACVAVAALPACEFGLSARSASDAKLSAPGTGGEIAVQVRGPGSGDLLLVLAGGPGLSHHYTAPLRALASSKLRVATFDQRGTGATGSPSPDSWTLRDYADDVESARVALGASRVHLLGHSWGGLVAMAYAGSHPNETASLLLVSPMPPTAETWVGALDRMESRITSLQAQGLIPAAIPPRGGSDCAPHQIAVLPAYFHDPKHAATRDLAGSTCHGDVARRVFASIVPWDLRPSLRRVQKPALVLEGESDPFGPEIGEEAAAALATTTVTIPQCGHIPWEECPQAFWPPVMRFLRDQAGVSPSDPSPSAR
jgi:proline iminopeptidase